VRRHDSSALVCFVDRFYDPERGTVSLDGHDVRRLDPRWLRQQMGVVRQEPALFAATIRQNVCYGLGGVEPRRVAQVMIGHIITLSDYDRNEMLKQSRGGPPRPWPTPTRRTLWPRYQRVPRPSSASVA
jgi:ABC-type iron transport system FetAB ATPase subunit